MQQDVTASGLTATALSGIVVAMVTLVTVIVAVIGILIDRSASRKGRVGER